MNAAPKYRVAAILLYQDGKVLMQHRDDRPDVASPGRWSFFGGTIEGDESAEEGARREVEEELGLKLTGPLERIFYGDDDRRTITLFAHPLEVEPETLTLYEGQAMKLLTLEEVESYPLVPLHRQVIFDYFKRRPETNQ